MRAIGVAILLAACGPAARDGDRGGDAGGSADAAQSGGNGDGSAATTFVYAHTSGALYRIDPDSLAVTLVGNFGFQAAPTRSPTSRSTRTA